ncbi:MAG: palmitoyltransferase swf1 [Vezdaea aestivalis]|nr:MAG: palmitoyltransferase swf1 [Vezdaea aestivalis]
MLASTSALLSYGCWLGYVLLSQLLQAHAWNEDEVWWKGLNITDFLQAWGWVITYNSRVGAVALLAGCTAPLAWGMLMYNVYLLWRGMTTNEHAKWKTLQDEAYDGELYAAHWDDLKEVVATDRHEEKGARRLRPPGGLVVVKTLKLTKAERESINRKPWVKLDSLENVTNMYDKGFMANIREAFLSKWDG